MRILVTSDFHGNPHHVAALGRAVADTAPDVFVYAGDLGPNRQNYGTPDLQAEYVLKTFFPTVERLPVRRKYVIHGNTDFRPCVERYRELFRDPARCQFCADESLTLPEHGYNLQFLASVSYTDHCLKDGERMNKFQAPDGHLEHCKRVSHVFSKSFEEQIAHRDNDEAVTASDRLRYPVRYFTTYDDYDAVPEAQKAELNRYIHTVLEETRPRNGLPTILISHSPPYGCNADVVRPGLHVGSVDIRHYVEDAGDVEAVFCGHIHQSFIVTKQFEDRVGSARVFSTGNTGIDGPVYYRQCHMLLYDTTSKECERLSYECQPHDFYLPRVFE